VAAWCLLLGSITNAAFLLEGYLGTRLDRSVSFVSELGARGEPNAAFFRLSDLVTGSLLFAGAAFAFTLLPRNLALRIGVISAGLFAMLTFADSFLPLDCPPTTDAACRAAEDAGAVSWQHAAHNVTGVLEGVLAPLALLAIALGSWQLRRRGELGSQWDPQWQLLTIIGVLYALISGLIAVMYLAQLDGVGVWQRLQIVLYSAGMFSLGLLLLHSPNDRTR
jgi:hypothetical protein